MEKEIRVMAVKRFKNLRVFAVLQTEYADPSGKSLFSNVIRENIRFRAIEDNIYRDEKDMFITDATVIITDDTGRNSGRFALNGKNISNSAYTVQVVKDSSRAIEKFGTEKDSDALLHSIVMDTQIYFNISKDDYDKVIKALDEVAPENGTLLISAKYLRTGVMVSQNECNADMAVVYTSNGIINVLNETVTLPVIGSLSSVDNYIKVYQKATTLPYIKKLITYNSIFTPQNVDYIGIVNRMKEFVDNTINGLEAPVFNYPDFTVLKDKFGRLITNIYEMIDVENVDKDAIEKARLDWQHFDNAYRKYDEFLTRLQAIQRATNNILVRDRYQLRRMYDVITGTMTGVFSDFGNYSSRKGGNKYVAAIFSPSVNEKAVIDKDLVERVLDRKGSYVFVSETDDGCEYECYETDGIGYSIFLLLPAFIDIDITPFLEIEDKTKELLSVLRGKVERHRDIKMDFSACTINNVSNYIADRFFRIQFMLQLISNCISTLKFIDKFKGRETVSLMEVWVALDELYRPYDYNIFTSNGMVSISEDFDTFLLSPGYSGVGINVKPLVSTLLMFDAIDSLGSEMTLNDKMSKLLKVIVDPTYKDRFASNLCIDIDKVNEFANGNYKVEPYGQPVDYTFDPISTSYVVLAAELLKNK